MLGMTVRHLYRLDEQADPPPWTGAGYECKQFGQWFRRYVRREMGATQDGEIYDYETERARLTKAQADRTELEAAEMRGDMVYADHVIEAWGRMLGAMRARLLALPSKSAPVARGADSDQEAARKIEAEVIEALQELSDDGLPERTRSRRERIEARSAAASSPDGERMGGRAPEAEPGKRRRAGAVEN